MDSLKIAVSKFCRKRYFKLEKKNIGITVIVIICIIEFILLIRLIVQNTHYG